MASAFTAAAACWVWHSAAVSLLPAPVQQLMAQQCSSRYWQPTSGASCTAESDWLGESQSHYGWIYGGTAFRADSNASTSGGVPLGTLCAQFGVSRVVFWGVYSDTCCRMYADGDSPLHQVESVLHLMSRRSTCAWSSACDGHHHLLVAVWTCCCR